MAENETVAEKIRKLLALAEGNQNEHERNVAMQFAMDLLAKHNLTLVGIKNTACQIKVEEVAVDMRLEPWVRVLLSAACKLYYTDYYITSDWDFFNDRPIKYPVFVGTAENINVTIDMAAWLLDSVRLESNRVYRESYERRSFRLGAAHRIRQRAFEMMETEKQANGSSTGTSLMVIRNKLERANEEYKNKLNLRPSRTRRSYIDKDAYESGKAYGQRVGLTSGKRKAAACLTVSS